MTWAAYYDTSDGRLRSVGSDNPTSIPTDVTRAALAGRPDLSAVMWSRAARAFVPRPPKVIAETPRDLFWAAKQAFKADPRFPALRAKLTAAERTALLDMIRDALMSAFGEHRRYS